MTGDQNDSRFIFYPVNHLFGIIDDTRGAETALRALAEAGFGGEEIIVFTGEQGAKRIDAEGTEHGLFARLVRRLQHMTPEHDQAVVYQEAARGGNSVVAIHANSNEEKELALGILRTNGAHFINFYGPLASELLDGSSFSPLDRDSLP
jgi:hypothetical protein